MSTPTPDEDDLAGSSVFRKPPARAWAVSFAAHAGVVVVLGVIGTYVGVKAGFIPPTIIELEAPPPRRNTPPPPPRQVPPAAAAAPTQANRPAPSSRPSSRPGRPGRSAPHVLAASGSGEGSGGDSMAVGDSGDWRGEPVGNGGGGAIPQPPVLPPVPEEPPRRAEPAEVAEENLAVRAVVDCDESALAGLYPQAAVDNEIEIPSLAIEMVVNSDGSLGHARARSNPGFGIASAMEQGALAHCRVTTVPRDRRGAPVRTRVVKRIRFMFE